MKRTLLLSALLFLPGWLQAQQTPRPAWLRPCQPSADAPALCGTYEVWENRETKRGRRIPLNVVVYTAQSQERAPDPVFYLDGGPGSAATMNAPGILRMLAGIRDRRDVVFVDTRGTGASAALDCPGPSVGAPLQRFFDEFLPVEDVSACRARLNADVGLYTNPIAMADIDELRAALGYARINLFGISGGTRAALVYLRGHPNSIRSIVLKGVVPMDMEGPLPFAKALESGLEALIAACRADQPCSSAYPDLAGDWRRVQQRFASGAIQTRVTDPLTRRTEQVRIPRGVFADGIRHLLYSVQQSRVVPSIIHAAAANDFGPFAVRELDYQRAIDRRIAHGAFLTITCAEDLRFIDEADIKRATAGTFLGDYRARRQQAACRVWDADKGVDAQFQSPVKSDVPALLISGAFDVATPPEGAERVARDLRNSRHLVFPNQSHDSANPACESRLIADFIIAGGATRLDVSCIAATRRPPFVTR
jgi:pimeloyl-ACP methyl ester carboxylesterase